MAPSFRNAGILLREGEDPLVVSQEVQGLLAGVGIDSQALAWDEPPPADLDIVIAMGGDGTVLKSLEMCPACPVLAINFGTVGFLTAGDRSELRVILARLTAGDYLVSDRLTLDCRFPGGRVVAVNEVMVRSGNRLVFTDVYVDEELLTTFFERLEAAVPDPVAPQLRWLVRSLEQEELAASIQAGDGPYVDRILTYADLVVPGEVEDYNQGITAGTPVRLSKTSLGAAVMGPNDIVILEAVPDDIPPVSGIVTAVPQTPLAHINLLAQSRGTPNAYVAGVMEDTWLEDMAKWNQKLILKVGPDEVTWKAMSKEDYSTWKQLMTGGVFPV